MKRFEINSKTDLYCIFGSPVRHSMSPLMHNTAFRETGINAVYLAFEPPSMQSAVQSMKSLGIRGAGVTIPFKIEAIPYLDSIDPLAADIGAVNTLVNTGGLITGYNTDGSGAVEALKNKKIPTEGSSVLILGNGGSARAIAFTLLENKAAVILAGRNLAKIRALADNLEKRHASVKTLLINNLDQSLMKDVDIIINTTPVGMAPDVDSMPLPAELLLKRHTVFDIVYSPLTTKLLDKARTKGCTIINGIDMLVLQGARQFEIWTGKTAPVDTMYAAISRHLR